MRTERLALRGKPHGNRRRMPSGGREPAEHGLLRRLLIEVKGLRIILFGETDDVVLRHRHWLALEAHADLQVVEPLDHCALASQTTPPRIVAGTRIKTRFALANDTRQSAGSPRVSVQRHHERQLRQRRRRGHRPALHPYRSVCPRATHPNRENLAASANIDEENLPRPISWMATACCRSTARTQVRDEPPVCREKSSLARTHRPP